jgi:hypothetical protein
VDLRLKEGFAELSSGFPTFARQSEADELAFDGFDSPALRSELEAMKVTLAARQEELKVIFDDYRQWLLEEFDVDSIEVLLERDAQRRAEEETAEEALNRGNSKQHQRIRALSLNLSLSNAHIGPVAETPKLILKLNNSEESMDNGSNETSSIATSASTSASVSASASASVSASTSTSAATAMPRASKNMSRMQNPGSGAVGIGQGHGQKDLSAVLANKPKVANQIPVNVFWNYVEPFLKPIDEDDLKGLDDSGQGVLDVGPFMIPPLGMHYEDIWYEQYGYVVPGSAVGSGSKRRRMNGIGNGVDGRGPIALKDRLLAALVDKTASIEDFVAEGVDEGDNAGLVPIGDAHLVVDVPAPLDERLRKELVGLGFADLSSSRSFNEDDEICSEMRAVQLQLRQQILVNQYRKRRLAEFIRNRLAAQEFYALIEDLERQIDGIFQKRMKLTKSTKKKVKGSMNAAAAGQSSAEPATETLTLPPPAPETVQCLENRRKLLEAFSGLLPSRGETLCPTEYVTFDPQTEAQIAKTSESSGRWLPLPDMPLKQPLQTPQPVFPISRPSQ